MTESISDGLKALKTKINAVAKLKTINRTTHWGLRELIYPPTIHEVSLSQIDSLNKAREIEGLHHRELDFFIKQFEEALSLPNLTLAMEKANGLLAGLLTKLKFEEDNLKTIFDNNAEWVGDNLKTISNGEELKGFILCVSRFDYELRLAQSAAHALTSAMTRCLEKYYSTISASQLSHPVFLGKLQYLDRICELIKATDATYMQCKKRVNTHIQSAKTNPEIKQQYQQIIKESQEAQNKKTENKKNSKKKLIDAFRDNTISENKHWLAAVTFDSAVKKMRAKQERLEAKAKTNPRYSEANTVADNLCRALQQLRHGYFDESQIADAVTLRATYSQLILDAHKELDNHRGVKKYMADAVNRVNSTLGTCLPFFKVPRTDSHKILDGLLQDLDAIDIPNIAP